MTGTAYRNHGQRVRHGRGHTLRAQAKLGQAGLWRKKYTTFRNMKSREKSPSARESCLKRQLALARGLYNSNHVVLLPATWCEAFWIFSHARPRGQIEPTSVRQRRCWRALSFC